MGIEQGEGVYSKGGKKRNERVKVSSDSCSFTRRGLLADLERPAEIWWGQIADTAGGGREW